MGGDHSSALKAASRDALTGEESEGSVVPVKTVKAVGGKGPCSTMRPMQ